MTANNSATEAEQPGSDQSDLDRLRDRTDELELIISSLTTFALFSLPTWLLDWMASRFLHHSISLAIGGTLLSAIVSGLCYSLAICFILHLMVRAYWVGLIGLRAAFPAGIRWSRTPLMGPINRAHYQARLPDLNMVIIGADRFASSLFAVISMLTLVMLWFGVLFTTVLVLAGEVGARFGAINLAVSITALGLLLLLVGLPLLGYLLDAQLMTRFPVLGGSRLLQSLLAFTRAVSGLAYPKRLVLPVQLTLQSNTKPLRFVAVLIVVVLFIFWVGNLRVLMWRDFTTSDQFSYLTNEDVRYGLRTGYYEDMFNPRDRLLAWPRLSSFEQRSSFMRVFLPYYPIRDNLPLDKLCGDEDRAVDHEACLQRLWSVTLGDVEVPMSGFIAAERGDLEMRGLIGIVPLAGLSPGMHRLLVRWNPQAAGDLEDDRYDQATVDFTIPFVFSPDFERGLANSP
jgi:hypothetical protein